MAHEKVAPSSDKVPRVALHRYRWRKFSAQPLKWYLTSFNNNKTHYFVVLLLLINLFLSLTLNWATFACANLHHVD
jgi:hypothetical protein